MLNFCFTGNHPFVVECCLHISLIQTLHGVWMENLQKSAVQCQTKRYIKLIAINNFKIFSGIISVPDNFQSRSIDEEF